MLEEDKVSMPRQHTWVRRRTVSLGVLDEEEEEMHPKTGFDGYRDTVFRYFMTCLRIQNASDTTFAIGKYIVVRRCGEVGEQAYIRLMSVIQFTLLLLFRRNNKIGAS